MTAFHVTRWTNRPTMAEISTWGIVMRRDDELIRQCMFELEDSPDWVVFFMPDEADEEDEAKYYHLRLLADDGFLEETGPGGCHFRITNSGHDFLGMMRNDSLWHQMKARAAQAVPQYGLKLLFEVGNALLRDRLREMGVPLP